MTVDFNPGAEKINRAILLAEATGSIGVAMLLRATRDRRIALFICEPENARKFKDWAKTTARQAAVALIADDDGLERGATAWKGFAFRMMRWAQFTVLHAAGAEPQHYEAVTAAAEAGARVLVIETSSASAPSWLRVLAAIPPRRTLLIWPRGGLHPVPDDRSKAH